MTGVLIRKEEDTQRHRQYYVETGRDWSNVPTNLGILKIVGHLKDAWNRFSCRPSKRN